MDPGETQSGRVDCEVTVLLAEFQVVSSEIANRSQAQHVLLNIAVVAGGATAAFVLTDPTRAVYAIVLSFISSFLGAIWLDHARVITTKGIYISSNLWPQLREKVSEGLTSHEDWSRQQDANRMGWLAFVLPLMGVFVLPALGGVVYSFPFLNSPGSWVAWAAATFITLLSLVYWVVYYTNHTVLTFIGTPYRIVRKGGTPPNLTQH